MFVAMDIQHHLKLYARMRKAVAEHHPGRLSSLEATVQAYDGDPDLLDKFLLKFGSNDPYEAAGNARLVSAVFRTPEEIKRAGDILGISESGHKLTDQIFVYRNVHNESQQWVSGSQAITKIMEAFGMPEQAGVLTTSQRRKDIVEQKKRRMRQALQEYVPTLEAVLEQPGLLNYVPRRKERIELKQLLRLDELKRRIHSFEALLAANPDWLDEHKPTYLLAMDPGGRFFGWFRRQLKELPTSIRDMYTTLTSPYVEIPEEKQRFMLGALFVYAASRMPIHRQVVLGGYQQDLEYIASLPRDHHLVQQYGLPRLLPVQDILRKKEITLLEASRVIDAYPFLQIRQQVNQEYLSRYSQEWSKALDRLRPLFIVDGKWREDSLGTSVPLERLKKSVYFSTLQREDFEVIKDMLRLQTLAVTLERFYAALPVQECKRKVDRITTMQRRLRSMDDRFKEHNVVVAFPEDAPEVVRDWKHVLYRRKEFDLAENFEGKYGLSLEELVKRMPFVFSGEVVSTNLRERMSRHAAYGLYSTADVEGLEQEIARAKSLIPYDRIREDAEKARKILKHPLIVRFDREYLLPRSEEAYTGELPVAVMQDVLEAGAQLQESETQQRGIGDIIALREEMRKGRFYQGSVEGKLTLIETGYQRILPEPVLEIHGVQVLDVRNWRSHCAALQEIVAHPSAQWVRRLHYLTGRDADALLRQIGLKWTEPSAWARAKDIGPDSYVQRTLMQAVDDTYQRLKVLFAFAEEVVGEGLDIVKQGELYDRYAVSIKGTTVRDKGRFKQSFDKFNYHQRQWVSYRPLSKGKIGELTLKLKEYNEQHGAALRMEISYIA